MGFINFMVGFAWEIILIFVAFALFGCLTKNGFGVIKEILNTIVSMMRAFGKWIREKCQDYLKGESAKQEMDRDTAVAAYNEYLKKCRAKCMTFEEFTKKMANGDNPYRTQ